MLLVKFWKRRFQTRQMMTSSWHHDIAFTTVTLLMMTSDFATAPECLYIKPQSRVSTAFDIALLIHGSVPVKAWWHRFLAHLSRRLTRWAYSIPMSVVRPSSSSVIIRRPHFQTWISLKSVGQSWSNFMCSITGVGERLHKVLGQIGSKLWFPWQQKASIDLQWGKRCLHRFSVVFYLILFILAGNEDMHKISDEFEFWPDQTTDYGVSCPWASKKFPIDL